VVNPWPEQEAEVCDLAKGETLITGRGKLLRFETAKGASYSVTRSGAPLTSFPTVTLSGRPRTEPRSYCGPQYLGDRSGSWTVYLGKPR
jgi:hypothetical protein